MHEISNSIALNGDAIAVEGGKNRARIIRQRLQQAALVGLQLAGLWLLNFAGAWAVQKTALPVPGSLVGMLSLYALLALGVVKVQLPRSNSRFVQRLAADR